MIYHVEIDGAKLKVEAEVEIELGVVARLVVEILTIKPINRKQEITNIISDNYMDEIEQDIREQFSKTINQ